MKTRPLVLVIDDSDDARDVCAELLRLEGFAVEEARDGQEGVQKAVELLPDIVITDVTMPIMDGWETIRRLKGTTARDVSRSSLAAARTLRVASTIRRRMCSYRNRARWIRCCSKFDNCFAAPPDAKDTTRRGVSDFARPNDGGDLTT